MISKKTNPQRLLRAALLVGFAIYCLAVLYVLILSRIVIGRGTPDQPWIVRMRQHISLVPFRSIIGYIRGMFGGMNRSTVFINLFGNFVLLFPMGALLPTLWRPMRELPKCAAVMLAALFALELMQMLLEVGVFDIDDFIMNLSGGLLGWLAWRALSMSLPAARTRDR